jgi:DEAD/DEAH box helicase domain-containing protein
MEQGTLQEGGLRWTILNRLTEVVEERKRLKNQIDILLRRIKAKEAEPKSQNYAEEIGELERERSGLMELVQKINQKSTLNFFTDEGLLPNYAFPEAGVTLKSVIWRQRMTQGNAEQGKYETRQDKSWLDYRQFSDLKKAINTIDFQEKEVDSDGWISV